LPSQPGFFSKFYFYNKQFNGLEKRMAQIDREKEVLYSQLRSIESDLSSASGAISDVESKLAYVEASIGSLPSRLMTVRGRGYAAMGHLEKSIERTHKKVDGSCAHS
jgi:septal ring factor EnvC (AmiA/AmiB activator)